MLAPHCPHFRLTPAAAGLFLPHRTGGGLWARVTGQCRDGVVGCLCLPHRPSAETDYIECPILFCSSPDFCVVAAGCSAGKHGRSTGYCDSGCNDRGGNRPASDHARVRRRPSAPVSIATMASSPTPSETPTALPTDTPRRPRHPATVDPSLLAPDLQTLPPYGHVRAGLARGNHVIRFSNSIPNAGPGVLKVLGEVGPPAQPPPGSPQHVTNVDGTYDEHPAGVFEFHVTHDHWHVENSALYEVWSLTADGELGTRLAVTDKVSYCLMDETKRRPDATLSRRHTVCDQIIQESRPGGSTPMSTTPPARSSTSPACLMGPMRCVRRLIPTIKCVRWIMATTPDNLLRPGRRGT